MPRHNILRGHVISTRDDGSYLIKPSLTQFNDNAYVATRSKYDKIVAVKNCPPWLSKGSPALFKLVKETSGKVDIGEFYDRRKQGSFAVILGVPVTEHPSKPSRGMYFSGYGYGGLFKSFEDTLTRHKQEEGDWFIGPSKVDLKVGKERQTININHIQGYATKDNSSSWSRISGLERTYRIIGDPDMGSRDFQPEFVDFSFLENNVPWVDLVRILNQFNPSPENTQEELFRNILEEKVRRAMFF